jgi:hypothetical protein
MATNLWVQSPSLIAAYGLQTGGIKGSQAPPLKTRYSFVQHVRWAL